MVVVGSYYLEFVTCNDWLKKNILIMIHGSPSYVPAAMILNIHWIGSVVLRWR